MHPRATSGRHHPRRLLAMGLRSAPEDNATPVSEIIPGGCLWKPLNSTVLSEILSFQSWRVSGRILSWMLTWNENRHGDADSVLSGTVRVGMHDDKDPLTSMIDPGRAGVWDSRSKSRHAGQPDCPAAEKQTATTGETPGSMQPTTAVDQQASHREGAASKTQFLHLTTRHG